MGTVVLELKDAAGETPLFDPSFRPFVVNMSHVDAVLVAPPGARVLAATPLDPHSALQLGERAWSVQFHPEIDGTVMRQYIAARSDIIAGEGLEPDTMLASAKDAAAGASVMRRFAKLVAGG
jgi:GMP synthase (glutamine-hydrolysing)